MNGRVAAVVLSLLTAGCVSSRPAPREIAHELLTSEPPSARAFHDGGETALVDQPLLDALAEESERRGDVVVRVVMIPRGIHSYSVFVLKRDGDRMAVLETAMSWGQIQGKWRAVVSLSEAQGVDRAAARFECTKGPMREALFGPALIRWDLGEQVTCRGEWLAEGSQPFLELFAKLVEGAQQTYAPMERR